MYIIYVYIYILYTYINIYIYTYTYIYIYIPQLLILCSLNQKDCRNGESTSIQFSRQVRRVELRNGDGNIFGTCPQSIYFSMIIYTQNYIKNMYIYIYIYTYICIYIYIYACMYMCIYTCIYIYIYTHEYTHIDMHEYIYIYYIHRYSVSTDYRISHTH